MPSGTGWNNSIHICRRWTKGREAVEKLQQTYEIGEQNVEKVADIIEIIE